MNQTVFITRTWSGIGEATTRRFAMASWNVIATMHHPESAGEIAPLPQVLVIRLDVEDRDSIERAVTDAKRGNIKRVASAVGEESIAVAYVHRVLQE